MYTNEPSEAKGSCGEAARPPGGGVCARRRMVLPMESERAGVESAGSSILPPTPGGRLHYLLHSVTFSCLAFLLVSLIFSVFLSFEDRFHRLALQILAYALSDAMLLLVSWLFLAAADGREFSSLGLSFQEGWHKELLGGLGAGAAIMGTVTGTMVVTHLVHYSVAVPFPRAFAASFSATSVFLLFAAALEEIGFRGYAFQRLVDALGAPGAVAISSVLFGLGHLANPSATPLSTANTVLAGIVMALGYLRTRGLWFPIGLHFAWNLMLGPIASLPVSGIHLHASLFAVRVVGPVWLTGGDYGPEGGIILTVVCLGGIAWLARSAGFGPSRETPDTVKYKAG